jgi:DNA topoisomerase VI subunit B
MSWRKAFTTSRELEFFTESELTTQIGYHKGLWPLMLVKELIDNAIDACETAGTKAIEIGVKLEKNLITVNDNGPGLSGKIIKGVLDYSVRVSDKKHYIAPTRGQLGNALKCVVAAPFVATGKQSVIEVNAYGVRHRVMIELDRIAQKPVITYAKGPVPRQIGTILRIHWPLVASYFDGNWLDLSQQRDSLKEAIELLLSDFAAFNPHVTFIFNGARTAATIPDWRKWRTDELTSAHWYRPADLRALIAAYIKEHDMPVRDFVQNFAGLARNRVRADVMAQANIKGSHLSDLVKGGDVNMAAVNRLLEAMRAHSKPVQPMRLGVIGQEHLKAHLESLGGQNFKYFRKAFVAEDDLPVVVEIAFATFRDANQNARRIIGLNWSPVLKVPSGALSEAIAGCNIQETDPVIYLIHVTQPRLEFADHGKGALA